ncbi:HTH-type transcriptional activator Btr [Paenibacillus konkukensis]|uniref:HTH-type transcriptional activator Btr n=1 Tax=Paenibacillus konkukensis TaxID=2020716 RepID=A0ABY4RUL9_9BACL|nr:AraC family transcriptional regulator [Paenibacillus konkukensis]UQZ85117.1 HTH-type transcriptional activator Btr [Paenibacillus konkukensis]
MISYMDYKISRQPIRIVDLKVDQSILKVKSLHLINVGHIPARIHYRSQATFTYWAIVYISGGSGTYRVNRGENQTVRQGSFFLLYPGAVFDYGPGENEHWDEHYFTIEGKRIQEWLDTWLTEPDRVRNTEEEQLTKINRIFMLMETGIPNNIDRAALLVEAMLLDLIMSSETPPKITKAENALGLIEAISDYVYRSFDAGELCERQHISFPTLRRIVSKYTGYPLNEYVHRLKMAEAKNILLNTDQSLKEIAASLGYHDVFYFSRLFKKFVGVSPKLFRGTV